MSKRLQQEFKRLQQEGILDRILVSMTKAINKMSDAKWEKTTSHYDKDVVKLMDKMRKAKKDARKALGR